MKTIQSDKAKVVVEFSMLEVYILWGCMFQAVESASIEEFQNRVGAKKREIKKVFEGVQDVYLDIQAAYSDEEWQALLDSKTMPGEDEPYQNRA